MEKGMRKCGKEKKEVGGRFSREMRRDAIFAYRPIARRSFTCFCHCFFRSGPSPFLDGNSFDFTPWSDWLLPVCLLVRCIDHKQLDSALTWGPLPASLHFHLYTASFSFYITYQPTSQPTKNNRSNFALIPTPPQHSLLSYPIVISLSSMLLFLVELVVTSSGEDGKERREVMKDKHEIQ